MTGRAEGIKDLDGMAKRLGENIAVMQFFVDNNFATYQNEHPNMSPVELTCSFFRHSFTGVAAANVNFQHESVMSTYYQCGPGLGGWWRYVPIYNILISNARNKFNAMISSGFWASYANEKNGWGLKFNIRGQKMDKNAELTICNFAKFLNCQFWKEGSTKPAGTGSPFDFGDEYQNNYMGVKRGNVKLINSTYNINFSTGRSAVSVFEAMGMGAMFMGMLLNGVSLTFASSGTSFNINDLAAAAAVYNGGTFGPSGEYANAILQDAFGSAFARLGKEDLIVPKREKGKPNRYTVDSLKGAVSAKGKVGKNYKKPIP